MKRVINHGGLILDGKSPHLRAIERNARAPHALVPTEDGMTTFKVAIAGAAIALLALSGCTSQRFSSINTPPPSTVAQPLEPAPAGTVTAGQLPPPGAPGAAQPGAFPPPPTGPAAPAPMQVAANAVDLTPTSIAGVWNASVAGQGCKVATPQTKFGQGYRAGPLHCPSPLDGVKSWNVAGKELALYDQGGAVLAKLYSTGGQRFDGQTVSGLPISLSR
jgi:hypothetical protein